MIYAIISDVHANFDALSAVLDDVPACATILHLGDLVGYGPQPNEVVAALTRAVGVMGNHDAAALGLLDVYRFNDAARASAEWTRAILDEPAKAYLAAQPLVRTFEEDGISITLAHGSPYEPEDFHYIFHAEDAARAFGSLDSDIIFVGHSHLPQAFEAGADRRNITMRRHGLRGSADELSLERETRYIVNVGSVGQPRDGDPFASYALLDTASRCIRWRRVPYDVGSAQDKIIRAGLPSRNAERLALGG